MDLVLTDVIRSKLIRRTAIAGGQPTENANREHYVQTQLVSLYAKLFRGTTRLSTKKLKYLK